MATESVATDAPITPEFMAAQNFDALLSDENITELESIAKGFGVNRRLLYAVLAQSKAQLMERVDDVEESANTYMDMAEVAKDYKKHLHNLIEQADIAETRILCVLGTIETMLPDTDEGGAA